MCFVIAASVIFPELSVVPLEIKFYAHYFEQFNTNMFYAKLNDFMLNQSKIVLDVR